MSKKTETPSQRAIRRVHQWIRTNKSGALHKVPGLTQAQLLILVAIGGVVDNTTPRGPVSGRPKLGYSTGLGPTVWTLASLTKMSHKWAQETLRWLCQPISDAAGHPLDLRGAAAPGGRRVHHSSEVVCHVPFVMVTGGGLGGGRRNRVWLHPAFFELTDEEFDMLEQLPPWPYDHLLNENSVPIQIGTGEQSEWELSSYKPEKNNTAAAGAAVEGQDAAGGPTPTAVGVGVLGGSCSSTAAPAAAVLNLEKQPYEVYEVAHSKAVAAAGGGICDSEVNAEDQFMFLVDALCANGINKFDLMAPDRVRCTGKDGVQESKNKSFRWTFRGQNGKRRNTKFGDQAAFDLDAGQVKNEYKMSLPSILLDEVNAKGATILGRDFYWRPARDHAWAIIVLDDVDVGRLPPCKRVVLQTSAHKFQALLLLDEQLVDQARHHLQSFFVSQGICDPGASGGIQPVRPPGSINRKPGRNSFVTRLVEVHLDAPLLCVADAHVFAEPKAEAQSTETVRSGVLQFAQSPSGILVRRVGRQSFGSRVGRTDASESANEMSEVMRMMKRGESDSEVLNWLIKSATARGKKSPARAYAVTTMAAAKYALAHGGLLPSTPGRAARAARPSRE